MGVNKKLLILSLLIVGSNLVYSASELDKYDGKTQSVNGGKEYENNVEQTINSGKWLHITDGKVTNNETGKIVVTGSEPVAQLAGEKAKFLNNGNIEVENGKGFYITDGNLKNLGDIIVTKGTGIQIQNGAADKEKLTNEKNIMISGTSTGIIQASGKVVNNGTITSKNDSEEKPFLTSGTGLKIEDGEFINNNEITLEKNHSEAKGNAIFQSGGILTNNGTITVSTNISIDPQKDKNGYGINQAGGTIDNLGTLNIKATGENSIGMNQVGTLNNLISDGKNGKIIIEASGKNSVGIKSTGIINNASEIEVNIGKGIEISGDSQINNSGIITVNGGVGITQNSGTITNKAGGVINITGGTVGIDQKAGTFTNETGGKINITGGKGFYVTGGTVENNGIIDVNSVTGLQLKGSSVKFENKNLIKVSSKEENEKIKGGIGVIVSEKRNDGKATFDNQGRIEVEFGAKGIQVGKGIAENNGTIISGGTNATGVYVNGDGIPKVGSDGKPLKDENGKIIMSGKYEKAEFTNNNQIVANGTGAKGIQFGSGSGKVTNNKDIIAKDGAMGVFFYQGLNNILINSGTIDAGNGSAIESGKDTNNTVVLKNGSNIVGNIKGNTGVDVLVVEGGGEYKDLSITSYDKIVSLKNENSTDDAVISNSNISLEFNDGTKDYTNDELNKEKAGLTIKDSNLVVDLTNKIEGSSLVDTGDGKLTLDGNMKIAFNGGNGEKEFNISEILGDEIVANNAKFESSAMWDYTTENGDLIAKKKSYTEAVGKSQLEDFGKALEQSENGKIEDGDFKTGLTLLGLLDASQFTDAMTQLSGGVHGYTVDFAAINSRTLSNTIKNRELNKDRLRDKALNSYDQEVAYINNHHKIGGLMNVDYNEDGILGITEKQIMPNGKLGLVYGGAKGKAKFENGKHGKANMDNLYLGGYYAYDFTDKLTLVSNANFVYSHTNVTRNIKFSKEGEDSKLEQTYDSTYPVFGFGGGATLYYTPYNSLNNSVTLYGGIDWTKIVQGNINEDSDNAENKTNVTIKNLPADEQMYDSVVPHIGLSLANNGYIFNRKYRLGVNVDYETELGNIKNGKKLKLSALSTPHRVETAERENIVSYSLNGALDLTEDFTIYGNYTKADSDEYDAERVEAGFKYKLDRMSDLFVTGPLLGNIENSKPYSRRWTGVASFILDGEDDSDRSYYNHIDKDSNQSHSRGDYATSLKLKPKFTLSLNDRDTKWSYYFETYYMSNGMGMNLDKNERRKSESRIHAEARWTDQYSKGRYGFNIGYRNEITSSPTLSQYVQRDRLTRGLHQFRFTPNFTYNLGNGFIFGGQTTGIIAYDYEGYRKGQTDFELENEYGITYNGLMPRWRFNLNYFREETWYDNDFRKPSVKGEVEGDRRYQSNQLRPRITYFFGNGGRVELSARMPLGNGYWYTSDDHGKKAAEKYETRYGLKYYQPITPGLTGMIGGEILTIKTKNTDHGNSNYGKETRDYSIRPTIGISYNF